MSKASVIVNDALQFLGVSSALMPADPDQQFRAFRTLQRLFDVLPNRNIFLEMQRPASVNAELREPLWSTEYLGIILAYNVAPYFQAELSFHQLSLYEEAMNELRRMTGRPIQTRYPDTLPYGAGNYCSGYDFFYYPGDNQYQYTLYDERKIGEAKIYTVDFSSEVSRRNTSVSSVAWSNIGDESATISGESVGGAIATGLLTFGTVAGRVIVKVRATFVSGEIYDAVIKVDVVDPEGSYRDAEHG